MPASHTTAPQVLNALNMSAVAPVAGYGGVAIQIQGTFTGTITFEASVQGSEFEPFRVTKSDNSTAVTTATTTGVYVGTVAGYSVIRARMSSYSNGGASVMIGAAPAAPGGAGGGGGSGTDVNLIEVGGAGISLGENTMANSLPVVIASDQTPIPITGSISATNPSVGATGADVPTDATFIGVSNATGDLTGLASVAVDLNSTTPPVVPVHGFYHALPGAGGPVVGGTTTNPIRIAGTGTAGTANAGVATIQGIASMTPVQVSQATAANLNATVVVAAGSAVIGHVITDTGSTVAVSAVVPGVAATNLGKAEDAGHVSGDVGVMSLAVQNEAQASFSGTAQDYVPTSADAQGNTMVVGNIANSGGDAGNPVKIGAIARSPDGTTPGSVSENNRTDLKADLNGRLYTNQCSPFWWSYHYDGSSALTDAAVAADPGDGFQLVITSIIFSTGAATACSIFFEEGSTKILGPWYLEAVNGRGVMWVGEKKVTPSTALTVTTSAAIAQSLDVQGYIQNV